MKPLHCPHCDRHYWMQGVCCHHITKPVGPDESMTLADAVQTLALFGLIFGMIFWGLSA